MSGHSKWHSIKHKKAATDAKRGRLFTRIQKEVVVAARMGGGDIEGNPRLRAAVQAAKDGNMPKDNIEKAIQRGTGDLSGVSYEDFTFEGYGQAGVALMVEGSTDNRNRTTAEIRHLFGKHGGNLGEVGCVAWIFPKKGFILVPEEGHDEEAVMDCALEAGAEDFEVEEGMIQITAPPEDLFKIREALESKGIKVASAKVERIPTTTVRAEGRDAEKLLKLANALEDHDDVTSVSINAEIDFDLIEQLS